MVQSPGYGIGGCRMEFNVVLALVLFVAAMGASIYGSMVGSGGGFIMVPVLLVLFPTADPALVTVVSLTGVVLNGVSGSFAYAKLRRIDYRAGLAFAAATVPSAIFGALVVKRLNGNQEAFRLMFGVFLTLVGLYSLVRRPFKAPAAGSAQAASPGTTTITDARGNVYTYRVNMSLGIVVSLFVGFMSSMLGIGGGLILTPLMVTIMGIPPHIATATAVFTLLFTSGSSVATHLLTGTLLKGGLVALVVGVGMVLGGQAGARLSQRVSSVSIVRLLAIALVIAGICLALTALG